METRANYILIGSFMMAVLIGGFLFIYWLAATAESRENVFLKIIMPAPVTGLPVGGQVLFNGIRIGDVAALDFDPNNPKVVVATARVKPSTPLREDVKATLNFTGLTGVAYIDLNGGTLDAPLLLDPASGQVPVIHAEKSFFDDIVDGARDVLKRADSALTTVDEVLTENRPAITRTLANVETFSQALADNSDGIRDFMGSLSTATEAFTRLSGRMELLVEEGERILAAVPSDKVTEIVDNTTKFTASLGDAGDGIDLLIADAQLAAKDLQEFTTRLNTGLKDVEVIIEAVDPEDVRKLVAGAGAVGELLEKRTPDIDTLIVNTSSAMDNISQISEAIRAREDDISAAIIDTRDVLQKVDTAMGRAVEIVSAVEPDKISNIVASVETFSDGLNASLGSIDAIVASVDPAKVGATVDGVAAAVENFNAQEGRINEIIASTNTMMNNFEDVSATVRGEQDQIGPLVADVRGAVSQLTTTLENADTIIKAVEPEQVTNIVTSVETFSSGLNASLESVDAIVASVDPEKVGAAVDGVAAAVANFNAQENQINEIIASTKSMMQNFEAVSATVRGEEDQIGPLVADVRGAVAQFTSTLENAETILKAVEPDRVSNIVASIDGITGGIAGQGDSIDAMIASARSAAENVEKITGDLSKRSPDIDRIITDANEITATLNATSSRIQGIVDQVGTMVEGDGEGLIVEATRAAVAIRKVAEAFESRANSIAGGLSKFATQGSADFSAAMGQVNRTLVSIQRAVETFNRSPNRVIFGGSDVPTYNGAKRR